MLRLRLIIGLAFRCAHGCSLAHGAKLTDAPALCKQKCRSWWNLGRISYLYSQPAQRPRVQIRFCHASCDFGIRRRLASAVAGPNQADKLVDRRFL
jgi:hypothetical protein